MDEKGTAILNRLSSDRAEQVACSRFFGNASVRSAGLISESVARCGRVASGKHVLCIADTTELNYQSHAGRLDKTDQDLGPVGNDHDIGFFLHPTLAVDAESEFPLGFSSIYCWNRSFDKLDKHERNYKRLPIEEKESYRWIVSSQESQQHLADATQITIIADREGDIYEEFAMVPDERTHLLIRSKSDRLLYDEEANLFAYLSSQPVAGTYSIKLKGDKRIKRKSGKALIEVRYTKVKIKCPQNSASKSRLPDFVELYVVEAQEHPSTVSLKEKPIGWRLLTTHVVENFSVACQMIKWYSLRWLIEQLFRTLKSEGLEIEASQLEKGSALKKLAIMALQVALKIMQLVQERDGKAGVDAGVVFGNNEIELLEKVCKRYEGKTKKQKNPYQKKSLAWAAWTIARIGGWKGYQSESPPGPVTMKRGLQDFHIMMIGWGLT